MQVQIEIQLSAATLQALLENGFSLVGFQPLQATPRGGLPVAWLQTTALQTNLTITWTPAYSGYVANSAVAVNGSVSATSEAPLGFGDVMVVGQDGSFTVQHDGPSDAMSVLNGTSTQWTAGLAVTSGELGGPIAGFPLYPSSLDSFAPRAAVLLVFQAFPCRPGQMVDRNFGQGLLVSLTDGTQVRVSFDINSGWNAGGASWATIVPPNTLLAPLLIQQTPLRLATGE